MRDLSKITHQTGFSMVEVLVTLIILLVGLLGLAGLMMQSQRSEQESYQRVQALVLLQDMVGRINANRNIAAVAPYCYAFTTNIAAGTPFVGTSGVGIQTPLPPNCGTGTAAQNTQAQNDIRDWSNALLGTTETFTDPVTGAASNAGAMIDARGCVSYDATTELKDYTTGAAIPGSGLYTVAVAWQGSSDSFTPPVGNAAMNCATGLYGAETPVTKRRIASISFRIGAINNVL